MRTAQEIYEDCRFKGVFNNPNITRWEVEVMAINEARRECIDEAINCAGDVAKLLELKEQIK